MNLRKFTYNYLKKRNSALKEEEVEIFRERLYQIKLNAIRNLEFFKEEAIENLSANGVQIHEAKTNQEAQELLQKLIKKRGFVVKSKSNTLNDLEVFELAKKNEWKITETDLGDFIVSLLSIKSEHPVLPALAISLDEIWQTVQKELNVNIEKNPEAVVRVVSSFLRQKILEAEVGLTGANAISAKGQIVILENEGNISLVSRIPPVHIVIAGIEKIVPGLEDAIHVCRCASIWGTGQKLTSYINIISGPSKTADIENELVTGAQGAKEVHLILLDDWRSSFIGGDFEQMLYCINCGACLNTCPVFVSSGEAIHILDHSVCFHCTTCGACTSNCPAKIDWKIMTKKAREKHLKEGKAPVGLQEMIENIRKFGNPFGKIEEGKIPKKLYCC